MDDGVTSVRCYIQEYDTASGKQGLRLREKTTTRRVVLGAATPDEHQRFLRFLVAGRTNRAAMPALFDTTGEEDCVLTTGRLEPANSESITFIYDDRLSYLFA